MPINVRHWWIGRKNKAEKEKQQQQGGNAPPKDPWGNVKK